MMMREQQWDRSNCRHFRIDVCLHQRIYMRAFTNARKKTFMYVCTRQSTHKSQHFAAVVKKALSVLSGLGCLYGVIAINLYVSSQFYGMFGLKKSKLTCK